MALGSTRQITVDKVLDALAGSLSEESASTTSR
jgi:hypothetical protein